MRVVWLICVLCVICGLSCSRSKGPFAYVTNERDGTITVIDTSNDRVYSTIKVGGRLRGIHLSEDRKRIWVAISYPTNQSQKKDTIAENDPNGNILERHRSGSHPENFVLDKTAAKLYIANEDAG